MKQFQTPLIALTQGLNDRPVLTAPLGSVRDVQNMFVTDRGLIRRPGIKHLEDIDVLGGDTASTFLNSQLINIEGEDCIAYFYLDSTNKTLKVRVISMEEQGTIDITLNVSLTIIDPAKDTPSYGKLLYLGNMQFVVLTDKAYVKATYATKADAVIPPMQWVVFETKDGTAFSSIGSKNDSISIDFALLGTPYVLTYKYTLSASENVQTAIDNLKLFIDTFPTQIDKALHNNVSLWKYYVLYNDAAAEYSLSIKNGRIDPADAIQPISMGTIPDYSAWNNSNGQLLLTDVSADITYIFDSVTMAWYLDNTDPNTVRLVFSPTTNYTIQYADGSTATGTADISIPNVKGIEFKDVDVVDSSSKILAVHKTLATEENLPKAVKGFTIEVSSLEGYPKTLIVITSGIYREETFYIDKSLALRIDTVGTPIWDIDISYGIKQLEFLQYVTPVLDGLTGVYYAQDDYVLLISIATNVAKYIVPPTIANNYIKDAIVFQGRVGLLAANGITFTKVNKPYEVLVVRPDVVLDSDPIDIGVEGNAMFIHSYEDYLLILAKHKQYLLAWEGYFSPKTVSLTTIGAYDIANVKPVTINNSVIFVDISNRFLELFITNQQTVPKPFYITDYTITEPIICLIAAPTISTLFACTENNTVYSVYVPPIGSVEKLYRPLSKHSFAKGVMIGEINDKLYFINPTTINNVRYIQLGVIDLSLIQKAYANQLTNNVFLGIDWFQQLSPVTASCTGDGFVEYNTSSQLYALDVGQYQVWIEYPETFNILELVTSGLYTINTTQSPKQTTVWVKDTNFKCLWDGTQYVLDPNVTDELAVSLFIGIPFDSFVQFYIPPVTSNGEMRITDKYNVVSLSLYAYGGGFKIDYYRDMLSTTPYSTYKHFGQELNFVEINNAVYEASVINVRTPVPYRGLVQISNLTEEPLIIYGYQARITYYERR